ncbi:hypothetical protein FHW64_000636 [Variovorax sp. Sphag1AA]|nr:hypothetical protein [Variovorax sp. Sphag1AA]
MRSLKSFHDEFAQFAGTVAKVLLGEPNTSLSKSTELRFGKRGSMSVDLIKGTWFDNERGIGGGVLDLIVHRGEADTKAQAVRWMEREGIKLPEESEQQPRLVKTYPYLDEDGQVLFEVCRFHPKTFKQRRPNGRGGCTWGVKGVRQVPYRLPHLVAKPDAQVFVVEGEKDADALAAIGLVATCNAGGANKWRDELTPHFSGRHVVVLPDNDDAGREHARLVTGKLRGVAAEVRTLELPGLPPKGDVSDWLEAGGTADALLRLVDAIPGDNNARDESRRRQQQDENAKLQDTERDTAPPSLSVEEMLNDCVWIASGSQVGRISNPRWVLAFGEFCDLTASCATFKIGEDGRRKRIHHAVEWKQDSARKTVHTRTFHAGAPAICSDPDGLMALNSWRPIARWPTTADVAPFIDQVAYLIPDATERTAFLDWLAHIEQWPGVLPHYGWLHIAKNTGTGRNWLASVLARVWRGYVAPNVDLPALLESQFNGALAGRVLAMVDEVQEGGGENQFRHANRLKSIVNAEERGINPKFGRQFKEHNSCRWLVFSNHDNALPLNDTDRRWRVLRHDAPPRSPGAYTRLYALLEDGEFINAVGVWLRARDISAFNPGERPPMNEAKRAAVGASKSLTQKHAEEIAAHWPADVITNADAAAILSEGAEKSLTPAMRRVLDEIGAINFPRTLKVNRQVTRCWVLRNHARWVDAPASDVAVEAGRARAGTFTTRSAAEVLAGVV